MERKAIYKAISFFAVSLSILFVTTPCYGQTIMKIISGNHSVPARHITDVRFSNMTAWRMPG